MTQKLPNRFPQILDGGRGLGPEETPLTFGVDEKIRHIKLAGICEWYDLIWILDLVNLNYG